MAKVRPPIGLAMRATTVPTAQNSTLPTSGMRVTENATTAIRAGNGRPRNRYSRNATSALKNARITMPPRYPPTDAVICSVISVVVARRRAGHSR